jgi:hypothetical protein
MLIALLRLFVVMQRYTIAQAKSREKGKNIFRKNNMVHVKLSQEHFLPKSFMFLDNL